MWFYCAILLKIAIFLLNSVCEALIDMIMLPISEILKAKTMQLNNSMKETIIASLKKKAEKSPNPTVMIMVHAQ